MCGMCVQEDCPSGSWADSFEISRVTTLRLIMGDHLTRGIAALRDVSQQDVILMMEILSEIELVPHHKQKIVLVLSAMRHFAQALRDEGLNVDYVRLEDPDNTQNFSGEVMRAVARYRAERLVVTMPGEWRVGQIVKSWRAALDIPVEVRADDRFLCGVKEFRRWASARRALRMEYFYRYMREKTGLLMEGHAPSGGYWNYDKKNRKSLPADAKAPPGPFFAPDSVTAGVMQAVEKLFPTHFGLLDGFGWAVTRADALVALDDFIRYRLARFGDYQDAMDRREPFLFHALLSPYLNIGLLEPLEVCRAAERALLEGDAPLNAVEGFIRQIIGWREYVRGVYWLKMPEYRESNALGAVRPLPDFFWTGETEMECVGAVVRQIRQHGYAHHIQRLMVTGNFALLAGLAPAEVERWYLAVFVDAFEWVELPNTHGMALFADGGFLASKPYAASGSYINRMSDYCGACRFSPVAKEGEGACPFNYLYWYFLMENRERLRRNPRLAIIYKSLDSMAPARQAAIRNQAIAFLAHLPVSTET
jgi:deoxyribodipyrimidine photolyase-related protein